MNGDLKKYFFTRYQAANFRVIPGQWPDFKSKEEIDEWLERVGRFA